MPAKDWPELVEPYFSIASSACCCSSFLTDNLTLLFSRSISKIAESIVSPEEKRFGL